jgi:uncharacterized protein
MVYDINSRPGVSYFASFFILLGLVGAGLLIGGVASLAMWFASTGKVPAMGDMLKSDNVQLLRMMQLVSTFFMFFLPAFFTALIVHRKPFQFLGFNLRFSFRQLILIILIMLAALPLVGALSELNRIIPIPSSWQTVFKKMEDSYTEQVKVLARITGTKDYIISLVVMAIAPAIFEETLFRGGMQNILQRWTKMPWLSIVITSVIFSAIHFSYYGFVPRLALGVILGLIFYYSGSLWLSVLAHAFNNALVVTQVYYLTRQGKSVDEAMNESYPLWWGALALLVLIIIMALFKRISEDVKRRKAPPEEKALYEKWMT